MVDGQLVELLHRHSRDWLRQAEPVLRGHGRRNPDIEIRTDLRGQSAGQVRCHHNGRLVVRYNLAMARLQPDEFIRQTVPHEIAHVVVYQLFGQRVRPHGREWREVMAWFGITHPKRCHSFATPENTSRRQRRWTYRCRCGSVDLSTTRHNRMLRGLAYRCTRCGEPLSRQT